MNVLIPRRVSGPIRPEAIAHVARWPATRGWASAWRPGPAETWPAARERCVCVERASGADTARSSRVQRCIGALTGSSVAAGRWQGAAGELARDIGRVPSKAVRGGAHPSGAATERWWRMLRAAAFTGGEVAPVMDDVNNVPLQCRGKREKVRGESIWTERERAVVLTNKGGWRRCMGGNQIGGGISGGRTGEVDV
jgi:hypothetical protein